MAEQANLTDRKLGSLKARPEGRYEVIDTHTKGLRVRVNETGTRTTFVLRDRKLNGGARVTLGDYPALSLAGAREMAAEWRAQIKRGRDPRVEAERKVRAEQKRRKNTFAAVAEDFITEKLSKERKGREIERDLRRDLMEQWGKLPISDIDAAEIAGVIKAKARKAPTSARNLLGTVKRLFQWAVDQHAYGIEVSPAAAIKPQALVGEKIARDRLLSEDEVFAFWRAAKRLPYPFGPVYQLLALTGLRLNEVADAQWSEFDPAVVRALRQRRDGAPFDWSTIEPKHLVWVIPAARMKAKASRARPHAVPLTPDMLAILERLPLFKRGGEFLFSTSFGARAVWMSDKVKKQLDARMLRTLCALSRKRGDDPDRVTLEPWVNHDLRRVVRSGLSRLRIAEEVREAVLAHSRPGIKRDYLREKREALIEWGARLRSIVEPPPPNVVALAARA